MHSTNESGDVERLLDVLGVPELPYQSFQKPISGRPPASTGTTAVRTAAAFPLLAAAIPEIADDVLPQLVVAERIDVPLPQQKALATAPFVSAAVSTAPPKPVRAPHQVEAFTADQQPVSRAPQSPAPHIPAPRPVATSSRGTQLQGVFDMLRGRSLLPDAEAADARGIGSLFRRR